MKGAKALSCFVLKKLKNSLTPKGEKEGITMTTLKNCANCI